VWSTSNTCPNWRLLWIDTLILAVGFCIAGIIVGRVEKWVVMRFMNEWRENTIVLDRKTIIWPLFGWYLYYSFFVEATEVSDVSTDVGVRLRAVQTHLTKIHVSLGKWTVATTLRSVSTVLYLLTPLQAGCPRKKPHGDLLFSKRGPTTLVAFVSSYHSRSICLILLHTFAKCLLAHSVSTSLGSRKAYHICIHLVTVIVLHPHMTSLSPLPDL